MGNLLKRSIGAALSGVLLIQGVPDFSLMKAAAENSEKVYYYGDLDGDECLSVFDLCLMKRGCLDNSNLNEIQTAISDLNGDNKFDVEDIKLLQDYLLARITSFPVGSIYTPKFKYNGQKTLSGSRLMEKLDRGTVAVSTGKSVFVSWRLLASDEPDIGFNLYRTTDGKTVKINDKVLTGGTNFTDTTADLTKNNTYYVKTVYNGVETDTDNSYTLSENSTAQCITIPINQGGEIHFVWVGDFNGDGAYDFLVDRCKDDHQKLEAYLSDGTYLWTIDLGYNSENKNQITPGASTIDVGMWDGATVYDIDCDGTAEVMVRIADGVTFGDGTVYKNSVKDGQEIAVINGMTGALEASAPVPDDHIDRGPKACMMVVGCLDGVTPSLITWVKNRNADKSFNSYMVAYGYGGGSEFKQQWKYENTKGYAEAHQFRVADVDYDGKDEILHIGYALNSDGSLRYHMDEVVHGDRYHIGSFCNANNGREMMGYGIQQSNPSGLLEFFYNASTGKIIWKNYAAEGTADVGRGVAGDVDPTHEGFEMWSFQGLYGMDGNKISDTTMYPSIRLWWNGDLLSESYNDGKIERWNYETKGTERVATTWKITNCTGSDRGAPMFYGDILGDWREEIIMTSSDYSNLVILTTAAPTDIRLNTLAQDPCYRNCMTSKGYVQSHMLSYYLGDGMNTPSAPDISYIGESDLEDNAVYRIKNVNSGKYMEVKSGTAEAGTNVHQWGNDIKARNSWKLVPQADGYYSLVSALGGGDSLALDVTGKKSTNGTNIEIFNYTGNDAQQFKIVKSGAGYIIKTKVSGEKSCVEIANAETGNGANVQQWELNGNACQSWIFEKVS